MNGWLFIYKPEGWSSFDVVRYVKKTLKVKKVGHTGTLDPLAEGVLLVAVGEACKMITYLSASLKAYTYDVIWGEKRSTDDAEGPVLAESSVRPTRKDAESYVSQVSGYVSQVPPQFSSCKINGRRAYSYARSGEVADLKAREVFVKQLKMTCFDEERASFFVECGAGVYVRSLGRDMAESLGTYGYVVNLKRVSLGNILAEHCTTPQNLSVQNLQDVRSLWPFSSFSVEEDVWRRLMMGQAVPFEEVEEPVLVYRSEQDPVIICVVESGILRPKRVLNVGFADL